MQVNNYLIFRSLLFVTPACSGLCLCSWWGFLLPFFLSHVIECSQRCLFLESKKATSQQTKYVEYPDNVNLGGELIAATLFHMQIILFRHGLRLFVIQLVSQCCAYKYF